METQLEWDLLVKLTSLSGSSKAQCSCDTIGRSEITWAGLFGKTVRHTPVAERCLYTYSTISISGDRDW